jgi:UDP-N-acetylmuramyl pentapeptide synthase
MPEFQYIVSMPYIIGESHIVAALAACAVVYGLGLPLEKAVAALTEYRTPPGRLSLLPGRNGSLVIDDTYNSSPVAAEAALALLRELHVPGRKIAILGDMMELGKWSQEAHRILGTHVLGACDLLVTVGIRATEIGKGAEEAGFDTAALRHFDTALQAGDFLGDMIKDGDVVLIKGSQSVRLEKAVKLLLAEPGKAQELLVRQEKEWEGR